MKELTVEDFHPCLQQWKIRMGRCKDRREVYIDGDDY